MKRAYWLILIVLSVLLAAQPGCFWRKPKPIEQKTFDVYGIVKSISVDRLVIEPKNNKGEQTFTMTDASIKGSDFQPGAQVHVYYKIKGDVKEVTMVVQKIK